MAGRTPGRVDVAALLRRFEEVAGEEKAERDALRMLEGKFDLNDFYEQIQVLKKMGPVGTEIDDEELVRLGAMISSMTEGERRHPERFVVASWEKHVFYDRSRLRRVARGSGRDEREVATLLDRFASMHELMVKIGRSAGLLGLPT